jgi:hypothetical protein
VVEYPWDDRSAMKVVLVERLGINGERMTEFPKL